ncbi:MAG: DUF3857 domain-containing protein [Acidobacteria bacterium]|nr:MAG: DUF3857 domain-containing protein [Acidobacteriota bacterium]
MSVRPSWPRAFLLAGTAAAAAAAVPGWAANAGSAAPAVAPRPAFAGVPGPDAEYLSVTDRYTVRADGAVVHERESRLQVNSFLAISRTYGETKVGWNPETETCEVVADRTVLPSGAVVEAPANAVVDDQPPEAERDPLWSGLRRKVIVHTGLEPGAVIEESWRITRAHGATPWFEFSEPIAFGPPVRVRVVEVELPPGTRFVWETVAWPAVEPTRESREGQEVWRWRFENVPARPAQPGAPAQGPVIVGSACSSAQALRAELDARIAKAGEAPEEVLAAARTAGAASPGDETRLLAVLDAVAGRLAVAPIVPSVQHWRPRPLAEVWRAGVATPLELAAVAAAALRGVGFAATAAVVAPEGYSLEHCPALAGLDRAVVAVTWGDDGVRLYDPAAPLEGGPLEAAVNRLALTAPGPLPAAPPARPTALRIVGTVASDGAIKATLEFEAGGAGTPHAALVRDPDRVAADIARAAVPGGKVTRLRVTGLGRTHASFTASVEGALPAADVLGLVRWEVAGVPAALPPPPVASGRLSPIAVPAIDAAIELTVTLAPGWSVAAFPAATRVSNEIGTVVAGGRRLADGRLEIGRRIEMRPRVLPAEASAPMRALLAPWLAPAGRELVLRPPTAAPARVTPGARTST